MKNTKIFLFAFLSFFLVGCDGMGGVTLTDTKGNKYTFKNESITCRKLITSILCEGSAVKKNIAGQRYVVDFERTFCKNISTKKIYSEYFICSAAKEFGKL